MGPTEIQQLVMLTHQNDGRILVRTREHKVLEIARVRVSFGVIVATVSIMAMSLFTRRGAGVVAVLVGPRV